MKPGGFYNKNSSFQAQAGNIADAMIYEATRKAARSMNLAEGVVHVADLGASCLLGHVSTCAPPSAVACDTIENLQRMRSPSQPGYLQQPTQIPSPAVTPTSLSL